MKPRLVKLRPRYEGSAVTQLRAALVEAEDRGIAEVVIASKRPSGGWSVRHSYIDNTPELVGALEIMKDDIIRKF